MRKRAVADVVQENGDQRRFALLIGNLTTFTPQRLQGRVHQVHGPQGVVKARVERPRVHEVCEPQLFDPAQPLKVGVLDDVEHELRRSGNEPVYRVVEDFLLVHVFLVHGPWSIVHR